MKQENKQFPNNKWGKIKTIHTQYSAGVLRVEGNKMIFFECPNGLWKINKQKK